MCDNASKPSGAEPFNQATKLERFYRPEKMRTALFKMEQFYMIWQDSRVDEKHKKAAKALFEHYRRLALCILAKEFNPKMEVERVLTPSFIDTMFSDFNPYLDASLIRKAVEDMPLEELKPSKVAKTSEF